MQGQYQNLFWTSTLQIKALIISYLDFGLGADVLTLLPDDIQADIVRRIAALETVEPGAIKELERVMKAKFAANTSLRASQIGGVKAAAKIMNFTKTEMEARILNAIKKRGPRFNGRDTGQHVCF